MMGIGAGLLEVKKKIYMKIDKINATGGPMFDRIFKIALIILGSISWSVTMIRSGLKYGSGVGFWEEPWSWRSGRWWPACAT